MLVLGAILAGGQSRRFGHDKAKAQLGDKSMVQTVIDIVAQQSDTWVICGRGDYGDAWLPDRPRAGLGPLAGLSAALTHASCNGFDAVFTAPCDVPGLPLNMCARFQAVAFPGFLAGLPVVGLWPASLAETLDAFLEQHQDHSLRAWCRHVDASAVALPQQLANINTPDDLKGYLND